MPAAAVCAWTSASELQGASPAGGWLSRVLTPAGAVAGASGAFGCGSVRGAFLLCGAFLGCGSLRAAGSAGSAGVSRAALEPAAPEAGAAGESFSTRTEGELSTGTAVELAAPCSFFAGSGGGGAGAAGGAAASDGSSGDCPATSAPWKTVGATTERNSQTPVYPAISVRPAAAAQRARRERDNSRGVRCRVIVEERLSELAFRGSSWDARSSPELAIATASRAGSVACWTASAGASTPEHSFRSSSPISTADRKRCSGARCVAR